MGAPVAVYAEYQILVVFDPKSSKPFETGLELRELGPWIDARALVAWDGGEQEEYTIRVVDRLDELEGLPQDRGQLEVRGAVARVGSIEALDGDDEGAFDVPLGPGRYLVTVAEEGDRAYALHFQKVEKFRGKPRRRLRVGAVLKDLLRTEPVLRQLYANGAALSRLLTRMGEALRATAALEAGEYLFDGDVWRAGATKATELAPDDVLIGPKADVRFKGTAAGPVVRYAWGADREVNRGLPVVLRASLDGDEVVDVALPVAKPLSASDAAECLSLVRQGFARGPTDRVANGERPPRAMNALQEWHADRLVVRLGPLVSPTLPKLRVELRDGVRVVDTSVVPPLRREEGHAVYEIWLVGPRAGCREARIEVVW